VVRLQGVASPLRPAARRFVAQLRRCVRITPAAEM
jgi:hypothetical protein